MFWFGGYLFLTFVIIVSHIVGIKWCWDYSNPVVVLSAVCSFLPFLYKTYYNKVINWIASGTLAVYVIHVTNRIRNFLENLDTKLLETNSYPMYLIQILFVIIIVFILSVLYGVACKYISDVLAKRIESPSKSVFDYR